jgi:hypothetical protein
MIVSLSWLQKRKQLLKYIRLLNFPRQYFIPGAMVELDALQYHRIHDAHTTEPVERLECEGAWIWFCFLENLKFGKASELRRKSYSKGSILVRILFLPSTVIIVNCLFSLPDIHCIIVVFLWSYPVLVDVLDFVCHPHNRNYEKSRRKTHKNKIRVYVVITCLLFFVTLYFTVAQLQCSFYAR